jgi:hypothetical protein
MVKGLGNFQNLSTFERLYGFDQKNLFAFDHQNFFCFDMAKSESGILMNKRFLDLERLDSLVDCITAGHIHIGQKH